MSTILILTSISLTVGCAWAIMLLIQFIIDIIGGF